MRGAGVFVLFAEITQKIVIAQVERHNLLILRFRWLLVICRFIQRCDSCINLRDVLFERQQLLCQERCLICSEHPCEFGIEQRRGSGTGQNSGTFDRRAETCERIERLTDSAVVVV